MLGRFARGLVISSLGALCLWSNPAQSRFGGGFGGHFGGGFRGFGGFGHFGGMRFGGMHFGGMHFGGMRFGGRHFGAVRFGGHHRSFAHRTFANRASAGHHPVRAVQGRSARHAPASSRLAGRSNAIAHAAIAGAGIHQLHGFNNQAHGFNEFGHQPFNRNGFGDRVAWNGFERRFPHHCCGWFGPVFWPFFFGDVFTAVLWPSGGYDPFWEYGSDYILSSILWAGYGVGPENAVGDVYDIYGNQAPRRSYAYSDRRASSDRLARASSIEAANGSAAQAAFNEACIGLAPGVTNLPIGRIQREVQPVGDQLAAFDKLKSALSKADEVIKASCSNEVALTPVRRLARVEIRLNAMADAVRMLKGPLTEFYDSLTLAQRQRLDAMRGEVASRAPTRTAPQTSLAALCSARAEAFSQVPTQRIEETLHPTAQQRTDFDALKMASANAANQLRSSCPAQVPTGMLERFQAVDARLTSMLSAVEIVRPALEVFYASLTDEQKARFNSLGEPQREAGANPD